MSEQKHTPGPWKLDQDQVLGPDDQMVVWELTSNDADVNLIIAAPEMYEALKETMRALRLLRDTCPAEWDELTACVNARFLLNAWDANKTAIAKAEGR